MQLQGVPRSQVPRAHGTRWPPRLQWHLHTLLVLREETKPGARQSAPLGLPQRLLLPPGRLRRQLAIMVHQRLPEATPRGLVTRHPTMSSWLPANWDGSPWWSPGGSLQSPAPCPGHQLVPLGPYSSRRGLNPPVILPSRLGVAGGRRQPGLGIHQSEPWAAGGKGTGRGRPGPPVALLNEPQTASSCSRAKPRDLEASAEGTEHGTRVLLAWVTSKPAPRLPRGCDPLHGRELGSNQAGCFQFGCHKPGPQPP